MIDSVQAFYDALADDYHLLFADWHASIQRQSIVLHELIRCEMGDGPHTVLDVACGIGTQAIGLALAGYRVHATDLSPAAVDRARRETTNLDTNLTFGIADLRTLSRQVSGEYEVVISCDNVLPHLLTNDDLQRAVANMTKKLRPDGLFLASVRDYEGLASNRPHGEGPRVIDGAEGRRITFQVWDWADDALLRAPPVSSPRDSGRLANASSPNSIPCTLARRSSRGARKRWPHQHPLA